MCLHPAAPQPVPNDTAEIAQLAFPHSASLDLRRSSKERRLATAAAEARTGTSANRRMTKPCSGSARNTPGSAVIRRASLWPVGGRHRWPLVVVVAQPPSPSVLRRAAAWARTRV